jgi:hypothetical protein
VLIRVTINIYSNLALINHKKGPGPAVLWLS